MDDNDDLNEVLDITQRQKRSMNMRRLEPKLIRAREIAKRKYAPEKNIKARAYAQARQIIRKRVAGERGAEYEKLGPSEKIAIDKLLDKKQKIIKRLALRLIPKIKQQERVRLQSFMHGSQLQNLGQPEEKNESFNIDPVINHLFANLVENKNADIEPDDDTGEQLPAQKKPSKKQNKSSFIKILGRFEENYLPDNVIVALSKKSTKSGIDIDILKEVYVRGHVVWEHSTSNLTQQQYAFARVNSFINKGKTYFEDDADLINENLKNSNPCWKDYKPVGTKKKAGKIVPNCVPVNEEERIGASVKVEGTNCRNCVYWRRDLEKPVTKEELNSNGGLKAPNKEYIEMSKRVDLGTLPGKDSSVKIKGFCDHSLVKDWVTERMCCSQWDSDGMVRDYKGKSPVMEGKGTSSNYINEAFNIAYASGVGVTLTAAEMGMKTIGGFALHPSVIEEMERRQYEKVDEDVKVADKEPVVIPAHKDARGNSIPAKTVLRRKQRKIIKSGNVHDGEPSD